MQTSALRKISRLRVLHGRLESRFGAPKNTDELAVSNYGGHPLYPSVCLGDWPICVKYQLRQADIPALVGPFGKEMLQGYILGCLECGEIHTEYG